MTPASVTGDGIDSFQFQIIRITNQSEGAAQIVLLHFAVVDPFSTIGISVVVAVITQQLNSTSRESSP